jgi:hypothetical protein
LFGSASAGRSKADVPDSELLFIELADGALDTHTIVVGTLSDVRVATIRTAPSPQPHVLLWQGVMPSDGSGPQPNGYFVRLYADGQAHCACPDWYFRGLQRSDLFYSCKHILRARARAQS